MRASCRRLFFTTLLLCIGANNSVFAHTVVTVTDNSGQTVPDAVVYAEPEFAISNSKPEAAVIEQKNKTFIPLVTVVQTGATISFPNNDTVKHQAYSFSPAKTFELKLYSGKPTAPLLFDKAGTVTVGCNIHDQMLAYIHVVNTPFFAKTDVQGNATLPALPAGKYALKVWHYLQAPGSEPQSQALVVAKEVPSISVRLNFKQR
ncbi:methylamine utilization protein [Undibacterium sp. SXout20W]|uniref:methylamine utilization protein n=1 Tax=Undibacterium sp. SXout20W TaxID=3413051 RepID=UPI003BF0E25F